MERYDVIICGAGPAGWPAAIQAARLGARTLLVEKSGMPGGTTTLNGVSFPGLFHAWGKQVIAGIGWDHVVKTVELTNQQLPDFTDTTVRHWRHQIRVCPAILTALIDESLVASGVEIRFHTMPAAVKAVDAGWEVTLCGKEGLVTVAGSWLIDCTGDANLAVLAGAKTRRSETLQPGTLVFQLSGYSTETLDFDQIDRATAKAVERGELQKGDFGWAGSALKPLLMSRGGNAIHVTGIDAVDSAGKTHAEIAGRAALLRIFRFLKTQPGFDQLTVDWCAPECGIRDTRTVVGESTITYQDYIGGRLWDDAVCNSFYPIDLHTDTGLKYETLKPGSVPTIPLSAMTPTGTERLLVAGRCVSGDAAAHSAYRVQASCMAMGQAAGVVAAIGSKSDIAKSSQVPLQQVRDTLRKHGAIVPG